jgi:opacity protein-like surface antigen
MKDSQMSPVVGGLASFTHREYTDMYDWGNGTSAQGVRSASTNALDVGLLVGVEFRPSKNVSFGLDYRAMTNVGVRYSDPSAFNRALYQNNGVDGYKPLEEIDYQFVSLSMSFMF